ncbi:hypothetical protein TcG_06765 [Trypanosoma cruzi]|nr:hypothetical protein BCY84_14551 [Trypanosoma cruzi cruzi]RNF15783.1 hypothetical protein TcG_06765 [Trypanosoma cruzi]
MMEVAPGGRREPPTYRFFYADSPEPADARGPFRESQRQLTSAALREAVEVQLETLEAIDRTEQIMNTAEDIGREARQQLAQDKEIIEVIDTALETNEPVLHRVRRDLRWFRVQLQKDRLFICLFGIVAVLSVAAVIVVVAFKRRR